MKANGGLNSVGKDRKRKITSEQGDEQDRTKVPQSASRRHREKINQTLEELGDLLPLSEDSRSKLDKLTVLKLSVSFFQTQNYLQSGKRKRRSDDVAVAEITKKLQACDINVSDISLEVLDSFFLVLSDSGDVFFASENVFKYLGYTQTFLMHQNFLNFVHHEDELGFKRCLRQATKARIIELDDGLSLDCEEMEERPIPQVCFCSIRCHAGRQSSHVSPFYYRSFKFDGNIKPLLNGKMKQYGYFALCTPVNPANPFTSTPKELLQMYSCKLGMDLGVRKLDIRGQKCLYFNEKDIMSRTGYFFVHPDDAPVMMLGHQRVTTEGHCEIVFRLMNGRGVWQWVRGKARLLYDKNDKPEDLATDNVLLNKEQGHYFQSIAYQTLREWKSRQKGLPSPKTNDEKFSKENSPDSALPSSASSDNISTAGQGFSSPSEDGMLQESKDIEIIEYSSPPISAAEKKEHVLPSLGLTAGTSESCMFSSANQNRSPVEEKPNILPHDGMALNFKTERRNGDATCVNPKPNHSAHAQINLIKQFLMGEENQPPLSSCQLESTVRVDGGVIRDSPSPWSEYPVDASSVLSELDFEQDDRLSAPCLPCPPQNGMQPSFYVNGYDHAQGKLQGQSNGLQFGGPQQGDSSNLIYPFLPDMSNPAPSSVSNPFVNGAHQQQDICDVHVQAGVDDLHKMLQNGTDLLPPYLRQEGTVIHSLQQRFNHPEKEVHFPPVIQPPTENRSACDFMGHARATQPPVQDSGLWFGSSNTVPLNHNMQVPQVEEILSVDDLTPSLFVDPMVPYGNPENFHNGNPEIFHNGHPENFHNGHPEHFHNGHPSESMYSASVYPTREMYMNQSMGQSFQTPQNKQQQKQVDESGNQSFQPGSKNSLLKMMLTL